MSKNQAPSIFNDVIGPVMRGPSSSHVAGAARIGAMVRQAAAGRIKRVRVLFDVNGSLAESHEGHGTDMGFACGLLGIPLTDERVDAYRELVPEQGIDLRYEITDYGAEHPNFYKILVETLSGEEIYMNAISTGGGMIEVTSIDGIPVTMQGDFYEVCCIVDENTELPKMCQMKEWFSNLEVCTEQAEAGRKLINLKLSSPLGDSEREKIENIWSPIRLYFFSPILPTHSSAECCVPFRTAEELLAYNRDRNLPLWELAVIYESARGQTSGEQVMDQMRELAEIMNKSACRGLEGTCYEDRILHAQAREISKAEDSGRLIPGTVMNEAIRMITAIMEAKSAMEVIVAAPTAGSCGCLPGTLLALEKSLQLTRDDTVKGLLAAGLIGVFFAKQATFAAEVGGCQMECGAGSGMAAAGAAQMMGASAKECIGAASVALQGLTGLACDPVANRVEVPCLNKNIVGGMNALSSANMMLSGFDPVIPLDETIKAMYDVGMKLPLELRCTLGGLGKTKTSMEIRKRLEQ